MRFGVFGKKEHSNISITFWYFYSLAKDAGWISESPYSMRP